MPGLTHLQPAQPVLWAFQLAAHGFALARDAGRFQDAGRRADVSPLGAGAIAGSSFPLDPAATATALGFAAAFDNAMDATADRDAVAELLAAAAIAMAHASRLAEDVALWAGRGWVRLPDAWATGSSMLPQKRNPDVAELVRGRAGTVIGRLAGFLATLKGLPLAYARDLQEDKAAAFEATDVLVGLPGRPGRPGRRPGAGPRRHAPRRRGHRDHRRRPGRGPGPRRPPLPRGPRRRRRRRPPGRLPRRPPGRPRRHATWPPSTPPSPPPTAPS